MLIYSASTWAAFLEQSTQQARAQTIADLFASGATIEFRDASNALIRSITTAAWTVGVVDGQYVAVPGEFTDAASGSGTPAVAIVKAGSTEIMRCTCGTAAGNWYRLLANFVTGVPIRRGALAFPVPLPAQSGVTPPEVITAPSISGTARVGEQLTATPGAYSGNPVPSVTRQWYRSGTAITGATGLLYTLVTADLGAAIQFRETATNGAGSVVGASNTLGPVAAQALGFYGAPAEIPLAKGGTHDLAQYVAGGTPPYSGYAVDAGTLPDGVTLSSAGVLSASGAAEVGTSGDLTFGVNDSAAVAALPVLGITSDTGGAIAFSAGHAFKQGDVPAGSSVTSADATLQCVAWNHWPDGSLKQAWLSGTATTTAGVRKDLHLSVGTAPGGAAVSLAALRAKLVSGSIQVGAYETVDLPSLVAGAPFDLFGDGSGAIFTGPLCSHWIWRRRIAGTPHLELWVPVRMYAGGQLEICRPWLQNGDFLVPSPTTYTLAVTISLAGTQRYSQSMTLYHHTVVPLVVGQANLHSYWYDADPRVRPSHDVDYLMASGHVMRYRKIAPSDTVLNAMTRAYTPGWKGDTTTGMSEPGASPHIGPLPKWQAMWLASNGDVRAFDNVIANGLSAGARSAHFRDAGGYGQNTGRYIVQSAYPQASYAPQGSPVFPEGSGNPTFIEAAHQPSLAYLPWLLTGDVYFLEEQIAWVTWTYLYYGYALRRQAEGYFEMYGREIRGAAWSLRSLAHLLGSCPETHILRPEWVAQAQYNVERFHGQLVANTVDAGKFHNNLGVIAPAYHPTGGSGLPSPYGYGFVSDSSVAGWYMPPWMDDFWVFALKTSRDLQLPIAPGSQTKLGELMQYACKLPVGLAGGNASGWPYTFFGAYVFPARDTYAGGGNWVASFADAWTLYRADNYNRADVTPSPSDPILAMNMGNTQQWTSAPPDYWSEMSCLAPHLGALAVAVEEGAEGALAAWSVITAAPNFTTSDMGRVPTWAVLPRNLP